MELVKILLDNEDMEIYFWTEEAARHYLENNSNAYHYEPDRFQFEPHRPLEEIPDHNEKDEWRTLSRPENWEDCPLPENPD